MGQMLLAPLVFAFAVCLALVPVCRLAALRLGFVAYPKGERWHDRSTALLGGVAIALTALGITIVVPGDPPRILLSCAFAIFIIGLVDDIWDVKPFAKLILEIAIGSVLLYFGYRLEWTGSLTLDSLLTLGWIIGITNAFNLLDNMDGLCAGIALITCTMLMIGWSTVGVQGGEMIYLAALLGATAAFLVYNLHPASIFMGDSGSLFIGVSLAVLALTPGGDGRGSSSVLAAVAPPVLLLVLPILDTTLVTASRLISGRSAAQGGRDHSSHRLVAMGLSQRSAVGVLWALTALGGIVGLTFRYFSAEWVGILAAVFVLGTAIFAVYLGQVRVYEEDGDSLARAGKITPFVVDVMYKRQIAEVVLDVGLVTVAYYSAYRLRFEGGEFQAFFPSFLESLPLVLAVQLVTLYAVGAYRGLWRYFSLMDGVTFAKGVLLGTFVIVFVVVYIYRFANYSRAIFVIYAALLVLLLVGSRASFRLFSEFVKRRKPLGKRLLIYGAGDGGAAAVRELLNRADVVYRMIGFADDDARKWRTQIDGYPVLGDYKELASLVLAGAVDAIVVSTRRIDSTRLADLKELCAEHGVRLSRLQYDFHHLGTVL